MRSSTALSTGGSAVELEGASSGVYRQQDGSDPTQCYFCSPEMRANAYSEVNGCA